MHVEQILDVRGILASSKQDGGSERQHASQQMVFEDPRGRCGHNVVQRVQMRFWYCNWCAENSDRWRGSSQRLHKKVSDGCKQALLVLAPRRSWRELKSERGSFLQHREHDITWLGLAPAGIASRQRGYLRCRTCCKVVGVTTTHLRLGSFGASLGHLVTSRGNKGKRSTASA